MAFSVITSINKMTVFLTKQILCMDIIVYLLNVNAYTSLCVCIYIYAHVRDLISFLCLTDLLGQGPSLEVNRFSASREILHIFWYLKVHYFIHKCLSPVPALSQTIQSMPSHPIFCPTYMPHAPPTSLFFVFAGE